MDEKIKTNLLKDLVSGIIDCKDEDLEFLLREYELFEIKVNDSLIFCIEHLCGTDVPSINDLIRSIYMLAIKKHDLDVNDFELDINYKMSRLTHLPSEIELNSNDCFADIKG